MGLRTTTWKDRNLDRLQEAKREANTRDYKNPTIVDIGPGGVVEFLADYFPSGKKDDWEYETRLMRFLLRPFESGLRKTGMFRLRSYEVEEVLRVFTDLNPMQVYVVDCEREVLDATPRDPRIKRVKADISREPIPCTGNIVICYHTIERAADTRKGLGNVLASVEIGGLISTTMPPETIADYPAFRRVGMHVYTRDF